MNGLLKREWSGPKLGILFILILALSVLWGNGWVLWYNGGPHPNGAYYSVLRSGDLQSIWDTVWRVASTTTLDSIYEEFFYRAGVLFLAAKLTKNPTILWSLIAILAVFFGLDHLEVWANMPLQGGIGFLWGVVFFMTGGAEGKFAKPFLFMSCLHVLYNVIEAFFDTVVWMTLT